MGIIEAGSTPAGDMSGIINKPLFPEAAPKEEIIIPPSVIRPFALWLTQNLHEHLTNVAENLRDGISYTQHGIEKNCGEMMRKKLGEISLTLHLLRKAKEVKLVSPKKGNWEMGWEFIFSEEKQDERPMDKKILIPNSLLNKIASALSHRIGSSLTPLHAQAGIAEHQGTTEEIKDRARFIHSSTSGIHTLVRGLLNEKSDILLSIKDGEAEEYVDYRLSSNHHKVFEDEQKADS